MENLPKRSRGRPRKIPEPGFGGLERRKLRQRVRDARGISPFDVPTERTAANRFYADRARGALPELSKSLRVPEDPVLSAKIRVGIDWILGRTTVLSELGRMMVEEPGQEDVARLQGVVWYIAERHPKITAKEAAAYAHRMRLGETGRSDRLGALHHDLNTAINYHRQRFPESSWADVLKALELTEGQIRKKLPTAKADGPLPMR
jgi:hypothetical protein